MALTTSAELRTWQFQIETVTIFFLTMRFFAVTSPFFGIFLSFVLYSMSSLINLILIFTQIETALAITSLFAMFAIRKALAIHLQTIRFLANTS